MNFIVFSLIVLITFVLTTTGATQIIGIILYLLPRKQYNTILGLILWLFILCSLYFAIFNWFREYFATYIVVSIISIIISIFNAKNLKSEL